MSMKLCKHYKGETFESSKCFVDIIATDKIVALGIAIAVKARTCGISTFDLFVGGGVKNMYVIEIVH